MQLDLILIEPAPSANTVTQKVDFWSRRRQLLSFSVTAMFVVTVILLAVACGSVRSACPITSKFDLQQPLISFRFALELASERIFRVFAHIWVVGANHGKYCSLFWTVTKKNNNNRIQDRTPTFSASHKRPPTAINFKISKFALVRGRFKFELKSYQSFVLLSACWSSLITARF